MEESCKGEDREGRGEINKQEMGGNGEQELGEWPNRYITACLHLCGFHCRKFKNSLNLHGRIILVHCFAASGKSVSLRVATAKTCETGQEALAQSKSPQQVERARCEPKSLLAVGRELEDAWQESPDLVLRGGASCSRK